LDQGKEVLNGKEGALAIATMTSKGQLTVPKEIRERLGLEPGDKVELVLNDKGAVTMRKRRRLRLDEVFGTLPTNGVTATLDQMEDDLGDAIVESVLRR
jgi:AbrB family looped-hinge helix DNA binding protein